MKEDTCVDASIEFIHMTQGWGSDQNDPYIQAFHNAVKSVADPEIRLAADLGGNDGHYFTAVGIPTACYGTIAEDGNFHGIDEWLSFNDYKKVKDAIVHFAETWKG